MWSTRPPENQAANKDCPTDKPTPMVIVTLAIKRSLASAGHAKPFGNFQMSFIDL